VPSTRAAASTDERSRLSGPVLPGPSSKGRDDRTGDWLISRDEVRKPYPLSVACRNLHADACVSEERTQRVITDPAMRRVKGMSRRCSRHGPGIQCDRGRQRIARRMPDRRSPIAQQRSMGAPRPAASCRAQSCSSHSSKCKSTVLSKTPLDATDVRVVSARSQHVGLPLVGGADKRAGRCHRSVR
jgi:hypothetical protein